MSYRVTPSTTFYYTTRGMDLFTPNHSVPMDDSHWQDVYAKHLPCTSYGYPLRIPEPMNTLPQHYLDDGLQIGDVGIVGREGQFDVLFNIFKHDDNPLHLHRNGVPKNFQPVQPPGLRMFRSNEKAISPGPIHSYGINQIPHNESRYSTSSVRPLVYCFFFRWQCRLSLAKYEFDSTTPSGAILILPYGAESVGLVSPEQLRVLATKNAVHWYEFAKSCYGVQDLDRSLYLVTGFHKARSWLLGSFNNPKGTTGKILVKKDSENPNPYLHFTFTGDRRDSLVGNKANQTVFITGFKISFNSWLADHVVLKVTESETTWSFKFLVRILKACRDRFLGFLSSRKVSEPIRISESKRWSFANYLTICQWWTGVESTPTLTQVNFIIARFWILITDSFTSPFIPLTPSIIFF